MKNDLRNGECLASDKIDADLYNIVHIFEKLTVDKRFALHYIAPEAKILIFIQQTFMRNFHVPVTVIDTVGTTVRHFSPLEKQTAY